MQEDITITDRVKNGLRLQKPRVELRFEGRMPQPVKAGNRIQLPHQKAQVERAVHFPDDIAACLQRLFEVSRDTRVGPARPFDAHDLAIAATLERFAHLLDHIVRPVDIHDKIGVARDAQRHRAKRLLVGKKTFQMKQNNIFKQDGVSLAGLGRQEHQALEFIRYGYQAQLGQTALVRLQVDGQIDSLGRQQGERMTGVNDAGGQHRHHLRVKVSGQPGSLLPHDILRPQQMDTFFRQLRQKLLIIQFVLAFYLLAGGFADSPQLLPGHHPSGIGRVLARVRLALQLADTHHEKLIKV